MHAMGSRPTSANHSRFVKQLRLGLPPAFEQLYRKAYPAVETMILKNSGTRNSAEDIFQEALIVLVTNLRKPGFQLSASPGTFVYAIARNLWLKQLRHDRTHKVELSLDDDDPFLQPATVDLSLVDFELAEAPPDHLHQQVKKSFDKLGEKCRQIIRLKHILGFSHNEIAEELDISIAYSRLRLNKCMNQLRRILKSFSG